MKFLKISFYFTIFSHAMLTVPILTIPFHIAGKNNFAHCVEQKQKVAHSNVITKAKFEPMTVYIIVGSTRPTKTGLKIAKNLKTMLDERSDVHAQITDLADYKLPFYVDEISPASRKNEITDPLLKKWSDKIKQAEGFIIISPEYNAGYPAVLKNALDSLYAEWNNKPVAFVGYSGGPSGGASMIAQLRHVTKALEMIPIAAEIKIHQSSKAFDTKDRLINADEIEKELNVMIDLLLEARHKS